MLKKRFHFLRNSNLLASGSDGIGVLDFQASVMQYVTREHQHAMHEQPKYVLSHQANFNL